MASLTLRIEIFKIADMSATIITPVNTHDIVPNDIRKKYELGGHKHLPIYWYRILVDGKPDPGNRLFMGLSDIRLTFAEFTKAGLGTYEITKPIK